MTMFLKVLAVTILAAALAACGRVQAPEPPAELPESIAPAAFVIQEPMEEPASEEDEPEPEEDSPIDASTGGAEDEPDVEAPVDVPTPEFDAATALAPQELAASTFRYIAYDYIGLSHEAVITDPAMLARLDECFSSQGNATKRVEPWGGGGRGVSVETNGVVKQYFFASSNDDTLIFLNNESRSREYYHIKDESLMDDLNNTYYNDAYLAESPYSYDMYVTYVYFDYVGKSKDDIIWGERSPTLFPEGALMERIKAAVADTSTPYTGKSSNPTEVGGEGLSIGISETRTFQSYHLYKLDDGTVVRRFNHGMNDDGISEDPNILYVIADREIYDYLATTYFADVKLSYNTRDNGYIKDRPFAR